MANKAKVSAIIVAAGESQRMGGVDKLFAPLGGAPALSRVLDVFQDCKRIDQVILVLGAKNIEEGRRIIALGHWTKVYDICLGGKGARTRCWKALKAQETEWIVIHDGARPFVTIDLIEQGWMHFETGPPWLPSR
jgi:2-C-methyl-D-erythritol 4-phosphate cytidylyltransferase